MKISKHYREHWELGRIRVKKEIQEEIECAKISHTSQMKAWIRLLSVKTAIQIRLFFPARVIFAVASLNACVAAKSLRQKSRLVVCPLPSPPPLILERQRDRDRTSCDLIIAPRRLRTSDVLRFPSALRSRQSRLSISCLSAVPCLL